MTERQFHGYLDYLESEDVSIEDGVVTAKRFPSSGPVYVMGQEGPANLIIHRLWHDGRHVRFDRRNCKTRLLDKEAIRAFQEEADIHPMKIEKL